MLNYRRQLAIVAVTRAAILRYCVHKDEIAKRLHELAGLYQTRPRDGWRPPPEWACWDESAPYPAPGKVR